MLPRAISFIVIYPSKKGRSHNFTDYVEKATNSVKQYYKRKNGRITPGKGLDIEDGNMIRQIIRLLKKLYPVDKLNRTPVTAATLYKLRGNVNFNYPLDTTPWELWISKFQGLMLDSTMPK